MFLVSVTGLLLLLYGPIYKLHVVQYISQVLSRYSSSIFCVRLTELTEVVHSVSVSYYIIAVCVTGLSLFQCDPTHRQHVMQYIYHIVYMLAVARWICLDIPCIPPVFSA